MADTVPDNNKAKHDSKFLPRSGFSLAERIVNAPYWLILFLILLVYVAINISQDPKYQAAWMYIRGRYFVWILDTISCNLGQGCPTNYSTTAPDLDGIVLTLVFAFISYGLAIFVGLLIGIVRARPPKPATSRQTPVQQLRSILYIVLYNVLTFYVEFMRGIPSLVFILLAAFVILPALRDSINQGILTSLGLPPLQIRSIDPVTGILSLSLIYSAYLSEVFRAGIQAISKGQVEAARSLGMTYAQTMRLIVVPQAIRAVLPPLGNDFIAIIKDTALLTILGVNDITQLSRKWVGTTFTYPETFLVLSAIYLVLTISGSLLVQWMERMLRRHER